MLKHSTNRFDGLLPAGALVWMATFAAVMIGEAFFRQGNMKNFTYDGLVAPPLSGVVFGVIVGVSQWLSAGARLGSPARWVGAGIIWWGSAFLFASASTGGDGYWLGHDSAPVLVSLTVLSGLVALIGPWLLLRAWSRRAVFWCLATIVASVVAFVVLLLVGGFLGYLLLVSPISSPYIDGLGIVPAVPLGGAVYGAITGPVLRSIIRSSQDR